MTPRPGLQEALLSRPPLGHQGEIAYEESVAKWATDLRWKVAGADLPKFPHTPGPRSTYGVVCGFIEGIMMHRERCCLPPSNFSRSRLHGATNSRQHQTPNSEPYHFTWGELIQRVGQDGKS